MKNTASLGDYYSSTSSQETREVFFENAILPPGIDIETEVIPTTGGNKEYEGSNCNTNSKVKILPSLTFSNYMFMVEDFLDSEEISSWIDYGNRIGYIRNDTPATATVAHRRQGRISFQNEAIASKIFDRLSQLLPPSLSELDGKRPVGCSKNIRLYEYKEGDSFGKHIDESNHDLIEDNEPDQEKI